MKKLIALLVLFVSSQAHAGLHVGLSDVIGALEEPFRVDAKNNAAITTVTGDFFQQNIEADGTVERGTGEFALKYERDSGEDRPIGLYKWEFEEPTRIEHVFDGTTRTIYDEENNLYVITELEMGYVRDEIDYENFLANLGYLSEEFMIHYAYPNTDPAGNYILEVEPRQAMPEISNILVVVDRDAVMNYAQGQNGNSVFPLLATKTTFHDGSEKTIEFSETDVNGYVSKFDFEIMQPAGVQVIRQTEVDMGWEKHQYQSGPQW